MAQPLVLHRLHVGSFRPQDVVLTVLCATAMLVELRLNAEATGGAPAVLMILLGATPVLVRSRRPIAALVLGYLTLFGVMLTSGVYGTMAAPCVLCAYAVADRLGRTHAALAAAWTMPLTIAVLQTVSPHPLVSWGTAAYLCGLALPLALGVASHDRRAYTAGLVERAEAAEHARDEEALRRVGEERLRIARDVHDAVAHAMVTINVQAGVGAHLIDRDPAQAHATLRAIKQVSGDALADLRDVLGLLRAGQSMNTGAPAVQPIQRLSDLEHLRHNLEAAGVELTLDVDPSCHGLPASVDTTCYRIVQESLTNTLRHAGPTSARVRIICESGQVLVDVIDGGRSSAHPIDVDGSGNGLRGMRERAMAIGGTLSAGPQPGGGWLVSAVLPLHDTGRASLGSKGVLA